MDLSEQSSVRGSLPMRRHPSLSSQLKPVLHLYRLQKVKADECSCFDYVFAPEKKTSNTLDEIWRDFQHSPPTWVSGTGPTWLLVQPVVVAWTVTHVDSVCLKYAHNKQVQYILSVRSSTKLNAAKETKEINQAAIYCTFKVVQWERLLSWKKMTTNTKVKAWEQLERNLRLTNKSYLCLKRQEHPVDYRKSDPPSTDASASSSHVLCLPNGPPVE